MSLADARHYLPLFAQIDLEQQQLLGLRNPFGVFDHPHPKVKLLEPVEGEQPGPPLGFLGHRRTRLPLGLWLFRLDPRE